MTSITRRGLLGALLAAGMAPAISRADSLMKLAVPPRLILWGDGIHDDTDAAQAVLDGRREVYTAAGVLIPAGMLMGHSLRISRTLQLARDGILMQNCAIAASRPLRHLLEIRTPIRHVLLSGNDFRAPITRDIPWSDA